MADEAIAADNAAFSAGDFTDAVRLFTTTISLSPSNHVLYSSRSAAYASLDRSADADNTVSLNTGWPKGYSHLGAAHLGLSDPASTAVAYSQGLELDPANDALKSGLSDAHAAAARFSGPPIDKIFQGAGLWSRLDADPTTRNYLQEMDFVRMLLEVQRDPYTISLYLKDDKLMSVLRLLMYVKPGSRAVSVRDFPMPETVKEAHVPWSEPLAAVVVEARKAGEAGNAAYKTKDFETFIKITIYF